MEQSSEYREQLLESYKQAVRPLLPYLPWLEQSAGKRASSIYSGQDIGVNSVSFPVYDGTLLNFVREATKSPLMDRNYTQDTGSALIRRSGILFRKQDGRNGISSEESCQNMS